jgi:hypothetical protein
MRTVAVIALLLSLSTPASSQTKRMSISGGWMAGMVDFQCNQYRDNGLHYQCLGFIQGWMSATDGRLAEDNRMLVGRFRFKKDVIDVHVFAALSAYLESHPNDRTKDAGEVLVKACMAQKLLVVEGVRGFGTAH